MSKVPYRRIVVCVKVPISLIIRFSPSHIAQRWLSMDLMIRLTQSNITKLNACVQHLDYWEILYYRFNRVQHWIKKQKMHEWLMVLPQKPFCQNKLVCRAGMTPKRTWILYLKTPTMQQFTNLYKKIKCTTSLGDKMAQETVKEITIEQLS